MLSCVEENTGSASIFWKLHVDKNVTWFPVTCVLQGLPGSPHAPKVWSINTVNGRKRKLQQKPDPPKVASVVIWFYYYMIFITDIPTGKMAVVEPEWLVLSLPSFSPTLTRLFSGFCVEHRPWPHLVWATASVWVTQRPAEQALAGRPGSHAELFPPLEPSGANSWQRLFNRGLVTPRSGLRGSWTTNKIIFFKKQGSFWFTKFSFCQTRSYNTGLCGFRAGHLATHAVRIKCPNKGTVPSARHTLDTVLASLELPDFW